MDNSQLPAYPRTAFDRNGILTTDEEPYFSGLTKLEAFTMAAMQGLLSNAQIVQYVDCGGRGVICCNADLELAAVTFACTTLSELSKQQQNGL